MAQLTPEMLEALLSMGDIGGQESAQSDQMALAKSLRGTMGGIQRNDTGSNIGRAAYGAAGAVNDYQAKKLGPQITANKQSLMQKLADTLRKKQEPATTQMTSMDGMGEPYAGTGID